MSRREIELDRMLAAHVPKDAREASHLAAMRHLLAEVSTPCSRDTYVPGHFTASAFVLSPGGDALLLILHGKLNRWLQPGGHVDPEDVDLEAAARREVREETGLADLQLLGGLLDVDVHAIPARAQEPAHSHFDVRFAFRAPHRAALAASDARGVQWVRLDAVEHVTQDASVLRAARALSASRGRDTTARP